MTPDEMPQGQSAPEVRAERSGLDEKFKVVLAVLVLLLIGEIYSFSRIHTLRNDFQGQEVQTRSQLSSQFNQQLATKMAEMEQANAQQMQALKTQLDDASKHLGAQRGELHRARLLVTKLQDEHNQQVGELKHEIALKADQQQLGALTEDVSSTKTDLGKTKQNVDSLAESLGLTRTKFGTLIARNHDEITALRKLGERDYFEFTASRHNPIRVGGVGLDLKKTNAKHHRFNVDLMIDDLWISKKDRTINEPVFFSVRGSRTFCELVVNRVDKDKITGYISTPKGTVQMASRLEGTR
jgi:hypothetical protein